jgi:hypothetical protein
MCIIFLSCVKNVDSAKIANTTKEETMDNQVSNTFLYYQSGEQRIRDLLHTQDELAIKWNRSVLSLKKVNFGIPGGDNWLVEWARGNNDGPFTNLVVYLINDYSIKNDYDLGLNYNKSSGRIQSQFDIMKSIPGAHISNGYSSMWDFNDDGLDELFQYAFGGMGNFILITGYNAEADDIEYHCNIPFDLIDPENGPAPLEFMTYKGMKGFKAYFFEPTVAGGPTLLPDPADPNNGKWFFYTWDEEQREYVRIEEVAD